MDANGDARYTITVHTLRKPDGVRASKSGMSMSMLQDVMSHDRVDTTKDLPDVQG